MRTIPTRTGPPRPVTWMRAEARRRQVMVYFVLAYAISWAWYTPMLLRQDTVKAGVGWPTDVPALFGPAVAAVIVTAVADGRPGMVDLWSRTIRWRVGWVWWLLVAGTLGLALLGALVPMLQGKPIPSLADFTSYTGIGKITPLGVVVIALLSGIGEETGWRGFASDRILLDHSLTFTALVVAVGWAGWHLPLFWLVDSFESMGILAAGWFIGLLAGSVILTYLYREGNRSILLVAAWHTAFNLTSATPATGAVVGTATSVLVICGALWVLRRDHRRVSVTRGS